MFGSISSRRNGLLHHRLEQLPLRGRTMLGNKRTPCLGRFSKVEVTVNYTTRKLGGRGGIRTHGPRRAAYFRGRCHRPLDHPSKDETVFLVTRVLFQHHHSSEPQPGLNGRGLPRPVCVAGPRLKGSIAQWSGCLGLLRTPDLPGVSSTPSFGAAMVRKNGLKRTTIAVATVEIL